MQGPGVLQGPAVAAEPANGGALDAALDLLGGRIAVLTGAGISTDSGIPDYRGSGAPRANPMTVQQFTASAAHRQRYWAGSYLGWARFTAARPNAGHIALAELERAGRITGIATQNVDGLHLEAGSRRVVEIHGTIDRVGCLACGQTFARASIAERIESANPRFVADPAVQLNPDGDAQAGDTSEFVVPDCTVCGGILKPEVVFFGEFVPGDRFVAASAIVKTADALLVAGSSLAVNSGIRLLEQARRRRIPVVVINRGPTKGDRFAAVRIEGGASETLTAIRDRLLG